LIEGGITMINELIDHGVIDQLELSVTPASDGDEQIDWKELLARFSHCTSHEVEGTTFYSAHN
jgi:riboflavin biosynthesis pyrimidine reductase